MTNISIKFTQELTGFPFVPTEAGSATATLDNDGLRRASFFCNPTKCIHRVLGVGNYFFYYSYAYCQQFIHIFRGKNIKFKETHTNLASVAAFPPQPYLLNFVTVPLAPVNWEVFFCVLRSSQYLVPLGAVSSQKGKKKFYLNNFKVNILF
jgi:hypothetical protein